MGAYTEEAWDRLGERVVQARVDLGFATAKSLAEAVGITPRLLGDLENGRRDSYSKPTLLKLERALHWAPGSSERILQGQDPIPREMSMEAAASRTQLESEREATIRLALSQESAEELVRGIQDRVDELRRRVDVADQLLGERQDVTASESATGPSPDEMRGAKTDYDLVADDAYGYSHEEEDELREMEP